MAKKNNESGRDCSHKALPTALPATKPYKMMQCGLEQKKTVQRYVAIYDQLSKYRRPVLFTGTRVARDARTVDPSGC